MTNTGSFLHTETREMIHETDELGAAEGREGRPFRWGDDTRRAASGERKRRAGVPARVRRGAKTPRLSITSLPDRMAGD